jgi:hypothetical protein
MKLRAVLIVVVALGLLAAPLAAEAQQGGEGSTGLASSTWATTSLLASRRCEMA